MKAFLICPVRGVAPDTFRDHVAAIEADGTKLHWPPRDTNQKDDPTGFRICTDNKAAIAAADVVYVIWDGTSQGCLFDLGVAFAMGKDIIALSIPAPTHEKSFPNMIRDWAQRAK